MFWFVLRHNGSPTVKQAFLCCDRIGLVGTKPDQFKQWGRWLRFDIFLSNSRRGLLFRGWGGGFCTVVQQCRWSQKPSSPTICPPSFCCPASQPIGSPLRGLLRTLPKEDVWKQAECGDVLRLLPRDQPYRFHSFDRLHDHPVETKYTHTQIQKRRLIRRLFTRTNVDWEIILKLCCSEGPLGAFLSSLAVPNRSDVFLHGVGLFRRWSIAPQCLERHRPSPYARGAFKRTPLHWACASGHAVAAAFLLLCVPVSGHPYRLGMDAGLWSQTMPGSVGSGFSTGCFALHGSLIPSNLSNLSNIIPIIYIIHYI